LRHVKPERTSRLGAVVEQPSHGGEDDARDREVDRHHGDQDPPAVDARNEADQCDDQQRRTREDGQE
jgi:hypothetical protein